VGSQARESSPKARASRTSVAYVVFVLPMSHASRKRRVYRASVVLHA
jgi:hypothetical protein